MSIVETDEEAGQVNMCMDAVWIWLWRRSHSSRRLAGVTGSSLPVTINSRRGREPLIKRLTR